MDPQIPTSPRSIYYNPSAKSYKAPQTEDNSAEIKAFYASLPNYAPTRLVALPDLAAELGIKSLYIKAETSRLGLPSFKLLGASWAVRQAIIHSAGLPSSASLDDLRDAVKKHDMRFCAATDGNHGRSVAFMGRMLGIKETKVFVPRGLDERIITSIAGEGADVVVADGDYDETVRTAHRFADENEGYMLIEAVAYEGYEDIPRWAVEGYTTMLHEIDTQLGILHQAPSMILAPVGVGSLTQAIISHYKSPDKTSLAPAVVTVEPDTAATLHKSLKAGKSLSITTSPTIMAGLECGTLSSIAWPLLKEGVNVSLTISDWECHKAICYLDKHDVGAGPCGAAALAGFRRLAVDQLRNQILDKDSVVVCICTEGARPYEVPSSVNDPQFGLETILRGMFKVSLEHARADFSLPLMNYSAQWLEYRDIEIRWFTPGTVNTSLIATLSASGSIEVVDRKESKITSATLMIFPLSSINKADRIPGIINLAASLNAFSTLATSADKRNKNVAFAIVANAIGLESVLGACRKVVSAVLVEIDSVYEEKAALKSLCKERAIPLFSLGGKREDSQIKEWNEPAIREALLDFVQESWSSGELT